MNRIISWTVFLGVCCILIFSCEASAATLGELSARCGFSLHGTENFSVQEDRQRDSGKSSIRNITAANGGNALKIEIIRPINKKDAADYAAEREQIIESLYKRLPNPYPGMITNTIDCPEAFKPEISNVAIMGRDARVYCLSSTERFTYGVCVDELTKYRGCLVFIYDGRTETLFRLELFYPKEKFIKEAVLRTLASFTCVPPEAKTRHNINLIIIAFDPLSAGHLSMYGYRRHTSPELERFSRGAFLFENAVSPSSWTLPVFVSWFTSMYPSGHKILNKYDCSQGKEGQYSDLRRLSPEAITLASALKGAGYATAAFTGGAGMGNVFGFSRGFDLYTDGEDFAGFSRVLPPAVEWLKSRKDADGGFFLFIHGYDVHGRHKDRPDMERRFSGGRYRGKYRGTPEEYWQLRNRSLEENTFEMSKSDVDFWRDWYDNKIYAADRELGVFLEEIKKLGLMESTVIVISSASGNEFYEHKRFDHGYSLYDEIIRVPLIIKAPVLSAGKTSAQVRTIDIMPTVLDLLGIEPGPALKRQIRGVSLVPLMRGAFLRLDAFSETDYLLHSFKRSLRKSDGWKLIYSLDTETRELYDLNSDPGESKNLIESRPDKARELETELLDFMRFARVNGEKQEQMGDK